MAHDGKLVLKDILDKHILNFKKVHKNHCKSTILKL